MRVLRSRTVSGAGAPALKAAAATAGIHGRDGKGKVEEVDGEHAVVMHAGLGSSLEEEEVANLVAGAVGEGLVPESRAVVCGPVTPAQEREVPLVDVSIPGNLGLRSSGRRKALGKVLEGAVGIGDGVKGRKRRKNVLSCVDMDDEEDESAMGEGGKARGELLENVGHFDAEASGSADAFGDGDGGVAAEPDGGVEPGGSQHPAGNAGEVGRGRLRRKERVRGPDRSAAVLDDHGGVYEGPANVGAQMRDEVPVRASRNSANAQEATRARFLQIARSRAAHFAHFAADDEGAPPDAAASLDQAERLGKGKRRAEDAAQPLRPEEEQDWPGPYVTARRLVEGRAAAAAARQEASPASTSGPVVDWSPTRKPGDHQFGKLAAPTLHSLCIELLCANVEHVVSLEGVPGSIKKQISSGLCGRRKMTPKSLSLFLEGSPLEISVPDCSQIAEDVLKKNMAQCSAHRLEVLELGMCGRGLSDECLRTFAHGPGSLPSLKMVSIRGAYRLTDKGLSALVHSAPYLTSLDLTQCCLLQEAGIQAVADCLGPNLKALTLDDCEKLDALKLLPKLLKMPGLRKISLSRIPGMNDEVVSELAVAFGSSLEELHLAECRTLTDAAVVGLAACCPGLKVLDLNHLPYLTDMAIGRLADGCRELRVLSLKRNKFSDEAMAAFITASGAALSELTLNSVRQAGNNTLLALAKHCHMNLELLDMSWCRCVTDEALGLLADCCLRLLELRLFGCTQVTRSFMDGHSNPSLKVIGFGQEKIIY